MPNSEDKFSSQKEHLKTQKQLRVWMSPEKLDAFKEATKNNDTTMYAAIHDFVDNYLEKNSN